MKIAWCDVPAGKFIMGEGDKQHTLDLPYSYKVSRYLTTNAQYRCFMKNGGYTTRRYWTDAGWAEKLKPTYENEPWTGPRNYGEPFNLSNHPVVGVSWYEAVAFCRWLTEVQRQQGELTADEIIRLPTEAEWEKAARGTDGRVYPWGNEADPNRANCAETKVKSTSAVGFFGKWPSPYGIDDMAGNVWEWCATEGDSPDWTKSKPKPYPYKIEDEWTEEYLNRTNVRILRGGSWYFEMDFLRCAYRNFDDPFDDNLYFGFRYFCVPIFWGSEC